MKKYLIGVDVGTTGAKAMVLDLEGNVIGGGYGEYGCDYPKPDWVEQNAEMMILEIFKACRTAVETSKIDPNEIISVGFSTQRATFGFVDANGNMINNRFYGWQDNRAASVIPYMNSVIDAETLYKKTGMPVTPTFSLEKVVWVMKNDPEVYEKAALIVQMPEYVMHRFGVEGFKCERTNACCSGMIDVHTLEWAEDVLDAFGIDKNKLPELVDPGVKIGEVTAEVAKLTGIPAGTALCTGTGDQQCAALGAGVVEDGNASLTLGTAGLLVVGSKRPMLEDESGFLMVPSSGALGTYELEGIQLGAASSYRWVRDVLCQTEKALGEDIGVDPFVLMDHHIQHSQVGSNGLIFMPYLTGSGYPYWNPQAKGCFLGLNFDNNRSDMVRSVMEGITLESKDMYEKMKATGVTMNRLSITGGATKSEAWRQIIADMFGIEINVLKVPDATIVGAAILGGVGAGIFEDVPEGVDKLVNFVETIQPIEENVKRYNEAYDVYSKTYAALNSGGVFSGISGLKEQ
jgi:xylulokinase